MFPKMAGMIGAVMVAFAVSGPALAFSDDPPQHGGATNLQQTGPGEPSSPEYRYSGNGFNFSMSRTPGQPEASAASQDGAGDHPQPPPRARPNFFQRTYRSIFGD
jgi:hypothetical protein